MTIRTKRLTDDITWISSCHEEGDRHIHLSQYVISDGANVLIDAGEPDSEGMIDAIRTATDGEDVDAVLLTHGVLPHTRNVSRVHQEWNDIDVVATSRGSPERIGVDNARPRIVNSTEEIAGRTFTFLDPLLTDAVVSVWIYDHAAKVLFTAEGVGHYHSPTDCESISDEMTGGIPYEHVHTFHEDKLPYLECVDPEKLRSGFEAVFDEFDIDYIAPMHGNPVARRDLEDYLDEIIRSTEAFRVESSA